MSNSVFNDALDTYKQVHDGVEVTIYQMPIPGFYGNFSNDVLEAAAERAVLNNWDKVILTWDDMPCSVCFEDGYCFLMAIDEATAVADCGRHMFEEKFFLERMAQDGAIYKEKPDLPEHEDRNPFEGDFSTYEGEWAV